MGGGRLSKNEKRLKGAMVTRRQKRKEKTRHKAKKRRERGRWR